MYETALLFVQSEILCKVHDWPEPNISQTDSQILKLLIRLQDGLHIVYAVRLRWMSATGA
jgi:hypothetical protein